MPDGAPSFMLCCMEASPTRQVRACEFCGLAVGTYEPAVFRFPREIIASSRAAAPGLLAEPDCRVSHSACFQAHAVAPLTN
jgi:hypothetical protein